MGAAKGVQQTSSAVTHHQRTPLEPQVRVAATYSGLSGIYYLSWNSEVGASEVLPAKRCARPQASGGLARGLPDTKCWSSTQVQ